MKLTKTPFDGLYLVELEPFGDERGQLSRVFCRNYFEENGVDFELIQSNISTNIKKGTLRGMHYQIAPSREKKIINCIKGKVFDAVVDIRKDSSTYLKVFTIELSEDDNKALLVPEGFAHGFQTLENRSTLLYFHSDFYKPGCYSGLNPIDPLLDISWPLEISSISEKDKECELIGESFKGFSAN